MEKLIIVNHHYFDWGQKARMHFEHVPNSFRYYLTLKHFVETVVDMGSLGQLLWKIDQNSQEKTCDSVDFFSKTPSQAG